MEKKTSEETDRTWFNSDPSHNPLAFGLGPCGRSRNKWNVYRYSIGEWRNDYCNSPIECCKECPFNPNRKNQTNTDCVRLGE